MSIADMNYQDDNYEYNPSAQEQTGPPELVLMPGIYEVEASVLPRQNDGEPVVSVDDNGNEWPVMVIPSIEVVTPFEEGGRFKVWQEVRTRPSRFNDTEPFVSEGAILLRSIDAQAAQDAGSFGGAVKELVSRTENGPVRFKISTGLTGKDSDWARAQIAAQGLKPENPDDRREIQKIWRKATLKTKDFMTQKGTKDAPAKYASVCKSPLSGKPVKASVKISRYLPSDMEVEFGVGKFPPKG